MTEDERGTADTSGRRSVSTWEMGGGSVSASSPKLSLTLTDEAGVTLRRFVESHGGNKTSQTAHLKAPSSAK